MPEPKSGRLDPRGVRYCLPSAVATDIYTSILRFGNRPSGWPQGPFLRLGTQNAFTLFAVAAAAFALQVIGTQVAGKRFGGTWVFYERLSQYSYFAPEHLSSKAQPWTSFKPQPCLLQPVTLIRTLTLTLAFYPLPSVISQGSRGSCSGSFPRPAAGPQGLSRQPWEKRDPKSPKELLK